MKRPFTPAHRRKKDPFGTAKLGPAVRLPQPSGPVLSADCMFSRCGLCEGYGCEHGCHSGIEEEPEAVA